MPGLSTLNSGGIADLQSISCVTPGNCAVGGTYKDSVPAFQGYVVTEKNGKWGKAIEIPNLGTLNRGRDVEIVRVACAAAGDCVAGGDYQITQGEGGDTHAFVASETRGAWGKATQLPGLNTLNFGSASVAAIACPSSGPCTAGGFYEDRSGHDQGFVVNQK